MALLPLMDDGYKPLGRSIQAQAPIEPTTLSLSTIIGIAVGGALVVFAILASMGIAIARRKHRLKMRQMTEVKETCVEDIDMGKALRSTRPPEICFSRGSLNQTLNPKEEISTQDWLSQDWLSHDFATQNPPMAKAKLRSTHLGFFRKPEMRDSWPLASDIQMKMLQGQSTISQSQVASSDYVLEDTKMPRRSRSSQKNSTIIHQEHTNTDLDGTARTPLKVHQRSTSESQLSTILRSTSQRLKVAHTRSLTRTMSVLGRHPGPPPTERLPTPLGRHATESLETLVGKQFLESDAGSICESFHTQSLNSPNQSLRRGPPISPHPNSPTPSNESRDSLCVANTPDAVIPASLTSPCKHLRGERRQQEQFSGENAKDISLMVQNDSRPSLEAIGGQDPLEPENETQRISLTSDPFYSSVKSSITIMPIPQIQGPRPQPMLYVCKATFCQEGTSERSQRFYSPPKDVAGNAEHTPKNSQSGIPNPFQWSPQETMQTLGTHTIPISERSSQGCKCHKRSDAVRMSVPHLLSSVEVASEEEDKGSPLSLESPRLPAMPVLEHTRNQSASPGYRSSAPSPSSAICGPTLKPSAPVTQYKDISPILGLEDIRNDQVSPTLSVRNYHSEIGGAPEDETFRGRASKPVDESTLRSRGDEINYFAGPHISPTHQTQQERQIRFTSFPSSSLSHPSTPILSPPSSRPLPSIDFSMSGGGVQLPSSATVAPPLLTLSTLTHLSELRPEPQILMYHKRNNSSNSSNNTSPQRVSVETSVALLRRMNSEVSHYSAASSPSEANSPILTQYGLNSSLEHLEERGRSRLSSKYYFSLGSSSLVPKGDKDKAEKVKHRVAEKRNSHIVYKERRKRRDEELEREEKETNYLMPVKEAGSPATGANALGLVGLRFPTLSREGPNGPISPRKSHAQEDEDGAPSKCLDARDVKAGGGDAGVGYAVGRWSDAMSKPKHAVIRRESRMEHPSPQTPPKWGLGLGSMELEGRRLLDGDKVKGESGGRPPSSGLYDQEGFLRSSPEREAVRLEKEKANVKRLSEFMM
jgi:hypothetical protein